MDPLQRWEMTEMLLLFTEQGSVALWLSARAVRLQIRCQNDWKVSENGEWKYSPIALDMLPTSRNILLPGLRFFWLEDAVRKAVIETNGKTSKHAWQSPHIKRFLMTDLFIKSKPDSGEMKTLPKQETFSI